MYIETGFTYNGIHSSTFHVYAVRLEGSLIEFIFGVNQNVIEEKINGKNIFIKTEKSGFEFPMTIALNPSDGYKWDIENRISVAQWLFQPEPCPLIFDDNINIVYDVVAVSNSSRFDNGNEDGYIKVTFRSIEPYPRLVPSVIEQELSDLVVPTLGIDVNTPLTTTRNSLILNPLQSYNYIGEGVVTSVNTPTTWGNSTIEMESYYDDSSIVEDDSGIETFKYTIVNTPRSHTFTLENKSNIEKYIYPEVQIEFLANTGVTMTNLSDGGKQFIINGVDSNTTVYTDNENERIKSSDGKPVLSKFNRNWFRLVYGINTIQVNDNFKGNIIIRIPTPMAV